MEGTGLVEPRTLTVLTAELYSNDKPVQRKLGFDCIYDVEDETGSIF